MTTLVTADRMRAIERAAIESGAVTGLELMERAGAGAVAAILAEWPELAEGPHRAVVLCGPGNNGGDGFVVARLLRARGWEVTVGLLGDPDRLPADARRNHERWDGPVRPIAPGFAASREPDCALVVDAIFGIGLSRPVGSEHGIGASIPGWDRRGDPDRPRIAALDVPTGLQSDTGGTLDGEALWADLTLAFHAPKTGHYLGSGPRLSGRLRTVDIGLPAEGGPGPDCTLVGACVLGGLGKGDPSGRGLHKFDHGHALVLAGGVGRGGAARLAARAALRVGAGLVTVAPPPAALIENAARLDAIMLRAVRDAEALRALLADGRINALCLGPGFGTGPREAGLLRAALGGEGEAAPRPTVLDGDAITLLSADAGLLEAVHGRCVLTPHAGEFARLCPDIAARLAKADGAVSKVDAAREAAARAGCTVLLKGPDTVIAEPSGRAAIHAAAYGREAPWLATAGAGDVLAGLVAGLMARGRTPFDAACAAAWLHAECALAFGPGLIAEDLPEMLPGVLARAEGAARSAP